MVMKTFPLSQSQDITGARLLSVVLTFPTLRDSLSDLSMVEHHRIAAIDAGGGENYPHGEPITAIETRRDLIVALTALARSPLSGSGCAAAASFALSLHNSGTRPKFDLFAALGSWDGAHRAAFARWVSDPVWV